MAVIYDPSKLKLVMAKYLDDGGQKIDTIAKENNALVAINASGHYYPYGYDAYAIKPAGTVIQDGKIYSVGADPGFGGGLIGFTYDNVLMLTKEDAVEAINQGMRDAVSFGPFLIVNGVESEIRGNGGYGIAPRTAIAQRRDGIVLLVVIDGRSIHSLGIDMSSLIDLFKRYKAYNAANLDGGGSSAMLVNGEILNKPLNNGKETSRYISNAWILTD
jgi:exopolysaccharide biosynthesis protein